MRLTLTTGSDREAAALVHVGDLDYSGGLENSATVSKSICIGACEEGRPIPSWVTKGGT